MKVFKSGLPIIMLLTFCAGCSEDETAKAPYAVDFASRVDFEINVIDSTTGQPVKEGKVSFLDLYDRSYQSEKNTPKTYSINDNGIASWHHSIVFGAHSSELEALEALPASLVSSLPIWYCLIEVESKGYFKGRLFVVQRFGDSAVRSETITLDPLASMAESE